MELVTLDSHNVNYLLLGCIGVTIFIGLMIWMNLSGKKKLTEFFEVAMASYVCLVISAVITTILTIITMLVTVVVGMNSNMAENLEKNEATLKENNFELVEPFALWPLLGQTRQIGLIYDEKEYDCTFTSPDEPGIITVSCGEEGLSLTDIINREK